MGPLGCTVVFKVVVLQGIRNENGFLDSGDTLNCAYWLPVSPVLQVFFKKLAHTPLPHPRKFPRLNVFQIDRVSRIPENFPD